MEQIRVYCDNTGSYMMCDAGVTLYEFLRQSGMSFEKEPLAAIVDNQLKELGFKIFMPHKIRFIDIASSNGKRTYMRSLIFLFQRAVVSVYPDYRLEIDYNLPNGPYAEIFDKDGDIVNVTEQKCREIRAVMQRYVEQDIPFLKYKMNAADAEALFKGRGLMEKAKLVELGGRFFYSVYSLDGYIDTFYGPLVYSTGALKVFGLERYGDGMFLVLPGDNMEMPELKDQELLYNVFKEDSRWTSIIGAKSIASVTECIVKGDANKMIQVTEALHERKYADIADMINSKRGKIKLVLIAGPSSSGKTTTSRRIALQCKVLGLNPKVIEMDNYFVDRDKTPVDESGNLDFESIDAMDLPFLNEQLTDLLDGKEIAVPTFDFVKGRRVFGGETMRLEDGDVLIMEGIHGLNPRLTESVPDNRKFRIYASALTSLSIDENNTISTSDNRLLRRIVRDNNFRGVSAEETILRWPSVRSGEVKNIFPYQENADAVFNSSLVYELPMLKYFAEPLLRRILPNSPAFTETIRLLKFMSLYPALTPEEIDCIPPTSVMREFIGGASW